MLDDPQASMTGALSKSSGTLYVVGTPIGNLEDLSPRARELLCAVEIVAAEDTRRTRGLLSSIGAQPIVIAYHEHNEGARAAQLLQRLRAGTDVALVSDAGMPLVSDPGWTLVSAALADGIPVQSVPGPSAALAALGVSGLPTDRFVFEGFLPRRAGQRAEHLRRLRGESRTMVFFESVHRLEAALARELTKLHESVYAGTLESLQRQLGKAIPMLGEFVIVVAGDSAREAPEDEEIRRIFALLSPELGADRAVACTAAITGASRNAVYRLTRLRH
jgi:16S rRNA (cytidine1402-2'-O)-methyltransferase